MLVRASSALQIRLVSVFDVDTAKLETPYGKLHAKHKMEELVRDGVLRKGDMFSVKMIDANGNHVKRKICVCFRTSQQRFAWYIYRTLLTFMFSTQFKSFDPHGDNALPRPRVKFLPPTTGLSYSVVCKSPT